MTQISDWVCPASVHSLWDPRASDFLRRELCRRGLRLSFAAGCSLSGEAEGLRCVADTAVFEQPRIG
jgi:hypothetical protein